MSNGRETVLLLEDVQKIYNPGPLQVCIISDALWKPSVVEGTRGLYNWGPPPPPSFIQPEDLAELMTASHGPA